MKKTIVISAIALRSGGTLSILQDCLHELSKPAYREFSIYVIVKDRALVGDVSPAFNFIELDGTRSYLRRLYYEYFYFRKLSRAIKADLWFSLHDITPAVSAKMRVVYCHNASPFYSVSLKEFFTDPKFGLFTVLYGWLYKINLLKNDYVVVQQDWLRTAFAERFGLAESKIIVARPEVFFPVSPEPQTRSSKPVFFYPTMPRVFKNIERIGDAIEILNKQGIYNFEVVVTIAGDENKFARKISAKYGELPALRLIGHQTRAAVFDFYRQADFLIFPSRLESWGLPITEFKPTGKPIILPDLPYARETAGDYDKLIFFDAESASSLATRMAALINRKQEYALVRSDIKPAPPFAHTWSELFALIMP